MANVRIWNVESDYDAEAQFRDLCASRGLDWDMMTDEERISFVDDLIHEDRECKR